MFRRKRRKLRLNSQIDFSFLPPPLWKRSAQGFPAASPILFPIIWKCDIAILLFFRCPALPEPASALFRGRLPSAVPYSVFSPQYRLLFRFFLNNKYITSFCQMPKKHRFCPILIKPYKNPNAFFIAQISILYYNNTCFRLNARN